MIADLLNSGPLHVIYDMSRLALRFIRPAPNGIDRVDLAYARRFVMSEQASPCLVLTALGPRLVGAPTARLIVKALEDLWRESYDVDSGAADDPNLAWLRRAITSTEPVGARRAASCAAVPRIAASVLRAVGHWKAWGTTGLFPGKDPARFIPRDAVYVNVSQFPFKVPGAWNWLEVRPDISAVFLIHDILPLTHPEFFPATEFEQHQTVVRKVSELASAIIVTSAAVQQALLAYLGDTGLRQPPIEVVPLDVEPIFRRPPILDANLRARAYFVACGTIEPRKNYLFLLNIWRALALEMGPHTPKLVLVGNRGWHDHNIRDMLERCEVIAPHVIECSGLSTPALKLLLDNSRGLLMPTFAEGFGLPVVEAMAAGVPVVASLIPAFANLDGPIDRLDPIDGLGWMNAIRAQLKVPRVSARDSKGGCGYDADTLHFRRVDSILARFGNLN